MEDQKNQMELLFEKATDYVETRLDLFKLKATLKSTDVISSLASRLILILIISLVVFMVNVGLALLLGEALGKSYYGFFVLGGVYLLVGVIFQAFKNKWVEEPVSNAIIKKLTK
jgi:hypothetical protein